MYTPICKYTIFLKRYSFSFKGTFQTVNGGKQRRVPRVWAVIFGDWQYTCRQILYITVLEEICRHDMELSRRVFVTTHVSYGCNGFATFCVCVIVITLDIQTLILASEYTLSLYFAKLGPRSQSTLHDFWMQSLLNQCTFQNCTFYQNLY